MAVSTLVMVKLVDNGIHTYTALPTSEAALSECRDWVVKSRCVKQRLPLGNSLGSMIGTYFPPRRFYVFVSHYLGMGQFFRKDTEHLEKVPRSYSLLTLPIQSCSALLSITYICQFQNVM